MAEAAGDSPHVDPGRDELGGGEVAQLVDVHVPAEAIASPAVPQGDGVGLDRRRAVGRTGEDEGGVAELDPEYDGLLGAVVQVDEQKRNSLGGEDDSRR